MTWVLPGKHNFSLREKCNHRNLMISKITQSEVIFSVTAIEQFVFHLSTFHGHKMFMFMMCVYIEKYHIRGSKAVIQTSISISNADTTLTTLRPFCVQVLLHGVSLPAAGSGSELCDGTGHVCTLLWRGSL